ncbi:transcriptional regulator PpsR [Rhodopseudomonas julia]|uniref:transcriptional regulator PpsR n=1 Tax=Rhodopseudomonas julia TaxID=200617 RepID=UPI0027D76D55|nr:transcriptional regulator PpsR [Rhodopseudomonas julia]
MDGLVTKSAPSEFAAPHKSVGDLDAEIAGKLIAHAADIALVLDKDGVVQDLAFGDEEFSHEGVSDWVGKAWRDLVTPESENKVASLLNEAGAKGVSRWRQVNHPSNRGADVAVRYFAMQVGGGERYIAIGRDLRPVSALQQRLIEAQVALEREYSRLRQAETRYRLFFKMASEAVLIIDANSQKVVEVNPAASRLLDHSPEQLVGAPLRKLFADESERGVQALLAMVRAAGHAEDARVRLPFSDQECILSASLFRQESSAHFLIRLSPVDGERVKQDAGTTSLLMDIVEHLPDAFIVTDPDRRILAANIAFLDLAQTASLEQVRGKRLERWVGRQGIELDVLIANLREHGSVRHFRSILRGEYGSVVDVEVAAVSVLEGEQPCLGFVLRDVSARVERERPAARQLPRSVDQLTELVGRVPLKDLVRETTDVIEKLCIEAALELTGDNRASAAEILGLSRQSLYSKLRRYNLVDFTPENGSDH